MNSSPYVLITSAKNEEAYISKTLESVIAQSLKPARWVIVSDGSTDETDSIVRAYCRRHPFIRLVSDGSRRERSFLSKVSSLRQACSLMDDVEYQFIGNLDADLSFEPDYCARLLWEFHENPRLGIGGGLVVEKNGAAFTPVNISDNSVAGAVQCFRRQCYEEIGGHTPMPLGGEDAVAEITARMKGWETRTFRDLKVLHHRRVKAGTGSLLGICYRWGVRDYQIGYHPLFYLCSSCRRAKDKPYLLGSLVRLCGYFWSTVKRRERPVPGELISYLRSEQMRRLREAFTVAAGTRSTARRPQID